MALARHIRLDAAEAWEENIGSVPCLIAKRYGRVRESTSSRNESIACWDCWKSSVADLPTESTACFLV
ncbi:MAG: hypothetical protein KGQ87_05545 [Verrucomicrobia bacterium]|nr:hypothetical protein [Verrucomicrobiota bacterium]